MRAKLYEEVWAEAVTKVAVRYGISDVALRKICKQLAVPLPPLGYWAKLAAGKQPRTPPLPKYSGPTEILRQRHVSDEPVEPDPEHLVARREFEARPENRIAVAETLDAPHPLVAATERALKGRKGRGPAALVRTAKRCLDLIVSETSLPRSLRIMDALVKALDARSMPLRIVDADGKRQSCVTLQGEQLPIRLMEGTLRTEREMTAKERQDRKQYGHVYLPDCYAHQPTGLLKLGVVASYGDLRNVGIENFRWHDLRHTWASWHVQLGTPLYVLKELGGWETLEMVNRYAHLAPEQLKAHAARLSLTAQIRHSDDVATKAEAAASS